MQTLATFVVLSRLAVSLCITGSLASMSTTDVLAQSGSKRITYAENTSASRNQATKLNVGPVLARNVAPKAEATTTPTATKVTPPANKNAKHDPKAVGRCWNRLMEMIREARQARRGQD
ncbi:hypothetical protein [Spirosoma sp. KUDC1026]|uniref:hypothetical protein n=1 Tax=Spirosoma sp. KUDC1026 TaxID=2745947 RepID=UPI00159B9B60|nr:hypothetical protein [Spirosoma sp. KUDC1026]QKZ15442.1 hypothetical protein HU175_23620 [Spirosoma sp. KUDC1026]